MRDKKLILSWVRVMIGKRLKHVRTYHGDRQIDLAKKLNVSESTVKSWERDNSSPSYEILATICRLYSTSADYLIGLSDNDPFEQKQSQDKLTPKNRKQIQLFEEFMLFKQEKEHYK